MVPLSSLRPYIHFQLWRLSTRANTLLDDEWKTIRAYQRRCVGFCKRKWRRKPEKIINEVASAISQFRSFAEKHLVEESWISAVETRLRELLESWGFTDASKDVVNIEIGGVLYENVRIEQTYKGNYHLYATINDKERKFVISKKREEYALLEKQGIANLDADVLKGLIEKFMA